MRAHTRSRIFLAVPVLGGIESSDTVPRMPVLVDCAAAGPAAVSTPPRSTCSSTAWATRTTSSTVAWWARIPAAAHPSRRIRRRATSPSRPTTASSRGSRAEGRSSRTSSLCSVPTRRTARTAMPRSSWAARRPPQAWTCSGTWVPSHPSSARSCSSARRPISRRRARRWTSATACGPSPTCVASAARRASRPRRTSRTASIRSSAAGWCPDAVHAQPGGPPRDAGGQARARPL